MTLLCEVEDAVLCCTCENFSFAASLTRSILDAQTCAHTHTHTHTHADTHTDAGTPMPTRPHTHACGLFLTFSAERSSGRRAWSPIHLEGVPFQSSKDHSGREPQGNGVGCLCFIVFTLAAVLRATCCSVIWNLEQPQAFGPYCTECKRDMHWTGKNSKGWKCRHHAVCGSSEESKGAERWLLDRIGAVGNTPPPNRTQSSGLMVHGVLPRHCAKCGDDICGECHPQGAAVIGGLFGPLDQRLLRPMDPLDELKLLKLNFMVMVLCRRLN